MSWMLSLVKRIVGYCTVAATLLSPPSPLLAQQTGLATCTMSGGTGSCSGLIPVRTVGFENSAPPGVTVARQFTDGRGVRMFEVHRAQNQQFFEGATLYAPAECIWPVGESLDRYDLSNMTGFPVRGEGANVSLTIPNEGCLSDAGGRFGVAPFLTFRGATQRAWNWHTQKCQTPGGPKECLPVRR